MEIIRVDAEVDLEMDEEPLGFAHYMAGKPFVHSVDIDGDIITVRIGVKKYQSTHPLSGDSIDGIVNDLWKEYLRQ